MKKHHVGFDSRDLSIRPITDDITRGAPIVNRNQKTEGEAMNIHTRNIRTLLTVAQLSEQCPGFTQPAIRWLLFNQNENGLAHSGAIIRNGRRVLIDVDKFFSWLDSRQHAV
jgi:hypothetical protein